MAFKTPEVKFYNGGDRIEERMSYDQPAATVPHAISYYVMNAPKKSFFSVPRVMGTPFGGEVPVDFFKQIIEKYAERGVVMIDANGEFGENEPYAANEEEAKKKGERAWKAYCRKAVEDFEEENRNRHVRGMNKMRPSGFVAHAFKELGMAVPGDEEFIKASVQKTEVDHLKEELAELKALLKGKAQPEPVGKRS